MISVREYLNQKGFEWRQRGDQAQMNCPFCGEKDRKFYIGLINGAFLCNHVNTCGVRGSFTDFQRNLGDEPQRLYKNDLFINKPKKNHKLPDQKLKGLTQNVIEYLKGRGFSDETIKKFKVQGTEDTVILPYFKNGVLVNNKYRNINEKKMWVDRDTENTLFNRDNIEGDKLIICEGEFDAMAFYEYGFNATSVPMGTNNFVWLENEWEYLEAFKTIYLCLDQDNAGQTAVNTLVLKLGSWRCKKVSLPFKDANDCLKNKVPKEEIETLFQTAKDFYPANLAMPSDFREEIHDLFYNYKNLEGTPTAWPKLNKILKGWRNGELTVWSGRTGAGKSTILNQHVISMAEQEVKTCIASLEMPPPRYLRWAIIQRLELSRPPKEDLDKALRYFDRYLFLINLTEEATPTDLLDIFEYTARRHNVKHFIVDSLMRVKLNLYDELNAQKEFTSMLVSFARKFDCHVHLVAHPRKGFKDSDIPGKVDIKGSSHITDLAHNVIVVWRPDEEDKAKKRELPDMVLMVKKNREFGLEGGIKMQFDMETKKYREWGT